MRVLLIPAFTALFYRPDAWIHPQTVNWTAAFIFAAAAVTDWFDGFLARLWKQTSERTNVIFAIIIIGREITISALREWMAQMGKRNSVAVATIGKFKTTAQMLAILLLLAGMKDFYGFNLILIGNILMLIASVLTIWSMFYYLKMAWKEFK